MDMQATLGQILNKIANEMQVIFGDKLKEVILFGSRARGDYEKDSDVDVMVLVDMDRYELIKYRNKVYEVSHKLDEEYNYEFLIPIILQDAETFNKYKRASEFFRNVASEGVAISA